MESKPQGFVTQVGQLLGYLYGSSVWRSEGDLGSVALDGQETHVDGDAPGGEGPPSLDELRERAGAFAARVRAHGKERGGNWAADELDGALSDDTSDALVEIALWPPDVFAGMATLLEQSAGHLHLANAWPPSTAELVYYFSTDLTDATGDACGCGVLDLDIDGLHAGDPPVTADDDFKDQVDAAVRRFHEKGLSGKPYDRIRGKNLDLDPDVRKQLYRVLVRSVARRWRLACRAAALCDRETKETIFKGATSAHPFHNPSAAIEHVPPQIFSWLAIVLSASEASVSSLGNLTRPPLPDLSASKLRKKAARAGVKGDVRSGLERMALDRLRDSRSRCVSVAVLLLVAASDEASVGMGVRVRWGDEDRDGPREPDALLVQSACKLIARSVRRDYELPASLCRRVFSRRCVVLPKMRTPQAGITTRALTHHLSCVGATEAWPRWMLLSAPDKTLGHEGSMSVLLVPWPSEATPGQFRRRPIDPRDRKRERRVLSEEVYGFFDFDLSDLDASKFEFHVLSLLVKARKTVGHVDAIVLPELSCRHEDLAHLAWLIKEFDQGLARFSDPDQRHKRPGPIHLIVGGVLQKNPGVAPQERLSAKTYPENVASIYLRAPGVSENPDRYWLRQQQPKHHRWHVTPPQVTQYGLGASLNPERTWVEAINIPRRTLHFWTLKERLTLAVLVCEDLAQADPIGSVVRSVAPNLVIALLADGPQIGSRWSARYATSLADDPGSSVLTLTSTGMARLSTAYGTADRSGVIAHWRDSESGSRELELPAGASALVLSLHLKPIVEVSADGRFDANTGAQGTQVVFGGVHPVVIGDDFVEPSVSDVQRSRNQAIRSQANRYEREHLDPISEEEIAFAELMELANAIDGELAKGDVSAACRDEMGRIVEYVRKIAAACRGQGDQAELEHKQRMAAERFLLEGKR
ncbi:MAG: hypothetical protein AAF726_12055 [Planctomycetota bacterium]